MKKFIFLVIILIWSVSLNNVLAVSQSLDTDYTQNSGSKGLDSMVNTIAIQSDGKIVVGGGFTTQNGSTSNYIARFNSDGTPDTTFRTNIGTGVNNTIYSVAVQSDDKIVVVGDFTTQNGSSANRIARFNSDGTPDTTFRTNIGNGFNNVAYSVAIQSDDKIVVGGYFTTQNSSSINRVARFNSNGTPDTTFRTNVAAGVNDAVNAIAIQSDDKIVVGGTFTTQNNVSANNLARFNSDGTPDTTFRTNIGTGFNILGIKTIAIQSDDKIVVGGYFTTQNGSSANNIARQNSDGTPDTTFRTNIGTGVSFIVYSIAVQSDDKIVVGGGFTTQNGSSANRIARQNSDGTPDTTFRTNIGTGINGISVTSLAIQSDDEIVVGGDFTSQNDINANNIARQNSDGTPDTTFQTNVGSGLNNIIRTMLIQSDDKIVLGGDFTSQNDVAVYRLARQNSDGTPDTTFRTNIGTGFNSYVMAIDSQSDDKIVVGGGFTTQNGSSANRIARQNSDGTPDTTFRTNVGSGLNNIVRAVAVQSDDKIVVGGDFTTQDGVSANRIARQNSDGTPDTTFRTNIGTGINTTGVYAVAIQSDGKIVVGGYFSTQNGSSANNIARFNSDGTPDTTFRTNIGTGLNNVVYSISIQSDDKIVVGGAFTTQNGTSANRIARFNSDGTPDTTFRTNIGTGFNGNNVTSLAIQSDGKIVVGGDFTTQNGTSANRIARFNSNGTPDTTFRTNIGTGFNSTVNTLVFQSSGKIIAGGYFNTYNNQFSTDKKPAYIARLSNAIIPVVSTSSSSSISSTTVTLGGNITATDGENATARGINYGLTSSYGSTVSESGSFGTGVFTENITGLTCATTYHYQAFATNTAGTGTSADDTFDTLPCDPTLTTSSASAVTPTTATLNGEITNTGGEDNTIRGFQYGATNSYGLTVNETGTYSTGTYSLGVSSLACNTLYYYRSYSTNSGGTGYGDEETFTTDACAGTTNTGVATSITQTTATLNGELTDTGGEDASERGFNYSTDENNLDLQVNETGSFGVDVFSFDVNSLTCNTTYYFQAYTINSNNTSNGTTVSFNTLPCTPIINLISIADITNESATLTADITDTGGENPNEIGFNYGIDENNLDSWVNDTGSFSTGEFSMGIEGLTCETTYYYEAYAINSGDTGYSAIDSFTTGSCVVPPTLTTLTPTNIKTKSVTLNATIPNNGGEDPSAYGFNWGETTGYQNTDIVIDTPISSGDYLYELTELKCDTTYHYRAYATNSEGVSYGDDVEFSTIKCPVTVGYNSTKAILPMVTNPVIPTILPPNSNNISNSDLSKLIPLIPVTVKKGCPPGYAKQIQKALNIILKINLVIDGKVGPKTTEAIKKFQGENNLAVDGLAGRETKKKMMEKLLAI